MERALDSDRRARGGWSPYPRTCLRSEALVPRLPPAPGGKHRGTFPEAAPGDSYSCRHVLTVTKVSDHVLGRLREWGVEHVFGCPGDGANGRLGACAATSGPGAIHLLNGLYDAKPGHVPVPVPVPAMVGRTHRAARGGSYQQEVDLHTLYKDVEASRRAGLEADGPAVIGFLTGPAVPPVPPHATWQQTEATAASVLKGDADRASMVRQGFKAKGREFLPGREKK